MLKNAERGTLAIMRIEVVKSADFVDALWRFAQRQNRAARSLQKEKYEQAEGENTTDETQRDDQHNCSAARDCAV